MIEDKRLFTSLAHSSTLIIPDDAYEAAQQIGALENICDTFVPIIDERALDVYERARNPDDPFELRDLWLGRIEYELGQYSRRPELAANWRASKKHRQVDPNEVLTSRATIRFIKELFNWFFSNDLYGELRSDTHIILSGGSADEESWGLPETLKECIRYALDRNFYGYSDSRGRISARDAVAAYESARIEGTTYHTTNVALTMGGTFSINALADFILSDVPSVDASVLCGIPNYPPLVEALARRRNTQLVPLPSQSGFTSLDPLIAALTPHTPLVLIQTVANPTGAVVNDAELERLILAASPSTMILLDECHEWLGPHESYSRVRAAPNVIRVFSISKTWSAPGLKVGWILADASFIADYYEYASTTYGGPPSFFYTMIEIMARMERWLITGIEQLGISEINEFEYSYGLELGILQKAYDSYRNDRIKRESALITFRDAASVGLAHASASIIPPRYSINTSLKFPGWDDSYKCFRDLLRETGVSVFPGILTFCFAESTVRVTTARKWTDLSTAITRLDAQFARQASDPIHIC